MSGEGWSEGEGAEDREICVTTRTVQNGSFLVPLVWMSSVGVLKY